MRLISVQKRNALQRKGFTLIELLVVITIIVILMALTLGVISKVYVYLDEVKTVAEVNKLATGCSQFKSTFGRYPPSRIILCETAGDLAKVINGAPGYGPPPGCGLSGPQYQALGAYSAEYLSAIFPGIDLTGARDWNGDGSISPTPTLLDGNQCLVYFLSGVNYGSGAAAIGFNTDKTNPSLFSTGARLGPFFEFDAARLDSTTSTFASYKDVYGTRYAYFAAKFAGMNNYPNAFFPAALSSSNDCHTLTTSTTSTGTLFFVPYFESSVPAVSPSNWPLASTFKFSKADTFQIISAGKDKQFGTGGQWNQTDPEQSSFIPMIPAYPAVDQASLQANYDNITNVTNGRVVPK